jgi:hypothetical protein
MFNIKRNSSVRRSKLATSQPRASFPDSYSASGPEEFADELDALTVVPLDQAPEAHARPTSIGKSHVEAMGELRAKEQLNHWRALGENRAREFKAAADEHRDEADRETKLIEKHEPIVEKALDKYNTLIDVLGDGYVRRHPRERHWYHVRMVFLLLGDLVGVAGGAIILGEIPYLAVLQAMAAAVAAITSGLLASEIKDSRLARQRRRDPQYLPEEHKHHAHLFQGPDAGEYLVKLMVFGALVIIVLLGIGIFMLRSSTEGTAAGVVFGMIAMAVAMASWVNSYHYSDELADKVEQAEEHAHRTSDYHRKLMAMPARAIVAKAEAMAESIVKEHEELGQAAHQRIMATVHGFHASRPTIFGHGFAPEQIASIKENGAEKETEAEGSDVTTESTIDLRRIAPPPSPNGHRPVAEEEAS